MDFKLKEWLKPAGFSVLVLAALLVFFAMSSSLVIQQAGMHKGMWFYSEFFEHRIFLSAVNSLLLLLLLATYFKIFLEMKSEYAIGMIVFASLLLFYSLSSNPLIPLYFGIRGMGLGVFSLISTVLSMLASVVLLYLAWK